MAYQQIGNNNAVPQPAYTAQQPQYTGSGNNAQLYTSANSLWIEPSAASLDPVLVALLSLLFPGLGHIAIGQTQKVRKI